MGININILDWVILGILVIIIGRIASRYSNKINGHFIKEHWICSHLSSVPYTTYLTDENKQRIENVCSSFHNLPTSIAHAKKANVRVIRTTISIRTIDGKKLVVNFDGDYVFSHLSERKLSGIYGKLTDSRYVGIESGYVHIDYTLAGVLQDPIMFILQRTSNSGENKLIVTHMRVGSDVEIMLPK